MGNSDCTKFSFDRSPSTKIYSFYTKPPIPPQPTNAPLMPFSYQHGMYQQNNHIIDLKFNSSSKIAANPLVYTYTSRPNSNKGKAKQTINFQYPQHVPTQPKTTIRSRSEVKIGQLPINNHHMGPAKPNLFQQNFIPRPLQIYQQPQKINYNYPSQPLQFNSVPSNINHNRSQSFQGVYQVNRTSFLHLQPNPTNPTRSQSFQSKNYHFGQPSQFVSKLNQQVIPLISGPFPQKKVQSAQTFKTNFVNAKNQPQNTQPLQQGPLSISSSLLTALYGNQQVKEIQIKQTVQGKRQCLQGFVNFKDDFLTHHLKYQLSLSQNADMKQIRRRQIIQHHWVQMNWGVSQLRLDLGVDITAFSESLFSSWMQRIFLEIWQQAHDNFFNKHMDYKVVRNKVASQYMFQLYQLKQFADAGMSTINYILFKPQTNMNAFMQFSDDALLYLFKKLKDRYPQTGTGGEPIDFPDVPSTKTNLNMLDNFPSLSFTDPNNMNYQTIYEDINFLLKKAIEEQETFKADMQDMLGQDVLACPKVGQVTKQGRTSFNAAAVRRVFVKWAQNFLQKCPDLYHTRSFLRFAQARQKIVNNFIFKSTVQSTTHKIVIDCVSLLLEAAKYTVTDRQKRQDFIFNIYDLLRCKIKRNKPEEIVALLERMKKTSVTKNGKRFEVVRVKNRFKTNNRDLLINFRYGDVLVGEAQLCVDNAHVSKLAKLNYDFCHYIYQLERSLFGPTLELMMEYQDFQRPDITVDFQAEDLVQARVSQVIEMLQTIPRKCLHGHNMISLVGDIIFSVDEQMQGTTTIVCNYCDSSAKTSKRYDYCYLCACILCTDCREQYALVDPNKFYLTLQLGDIPQINSHKELAALCNQHKSMIVLFWLQNSSASQMFRDAITYHQSKLKMQPGKYIPRIAFVKYSTSPQCMDLCSRYGVKDFPTMILLDGQAKEVRTIIGLSWFQAPTIYKMHELLIERESVVTGQYCWQYECAKLMQKKPIDPNNKSCQTCFGASPTTYFALGEQGNGMYCQNNHFRCLNCCYAALPTPTIFKDFIGSSYLSTPLVNSHIMRCLKGHQLTLGKKTSVDKWEYSCFRCRLPRYYDNQNGVGECSQCNVSLCPKCMGLNIPTMEQLVRGSQLVRHYVSCTAEDASLCICHRHFKKCYLSLPLNVEGYKINAFQRDPWMCMLCQQKGKEGELHLACFVCEKFAQSQGVEKCNFEICIPCGKRSKILQRDAEKKVGQKRCAFVCPKDKQQMVQTSYAYNKQLTVICQYCKKTYYGNSDRFYCKTCDLNCCKNCQQQLLQNSQIPVCKQRCLKGHALKFGFVNDENMQFCDGCLIAIKREEYKCIEDDYRLCTSCVENNPPEFIGNAFNQTAATIVKAIFSTFSIKSGNEIQGGQLSNQSLQS